MRSLVFGREGAEVGGGAGQVADFNPRAHAAPTSEIRSSMASGRGAAKPAARTRRGPTLDINAIASGKYDVRSAIQGDADARTVLAAAIGRLGTRAPRSTSR